MPHVVSELRLKSLASDRELKVAGVSPTRATARLHRFQKVKFGPDQVLNPMLVVSSYRNHMIDAVIGVPYLKRHRIWISYPHAEILVATNEKRDTEGEGPVIAP